MLKKACWSITVVVEHQSSPFFPSRIPHATTFFMMEILLIQIDTKNTNFTENTTSHFPHTFTLQTLQWKEKPIQMSEAKPDQTRPNRIKSYAEIKSRAWLSNSLCTRKNTQIHQKQISRGWCRFRTIVQIMYITYKTRVDVGILPSLYCNDICRNQI